MKTDKFTLPFYIALFLIVGCSNRKGREETRATSNATATSVAEILGAGATFPYPLYSKMFDEYNKQTGVEVNYQSIGSAGGIKQLLAKTIDFAASDAYLSNEQMKEIEEEIVHFPICLGAIVITYNLPGNPKLKFTPRTLADIFLGKIKKWDDTRIQKVNEGTQLPDMDIVVVHRSDGSGTTFIFTDYLSKVSTEWSRKIGYRTSVDWPTGIGAKGNEGVSGIVKQTPGSIAYVELIYALQNKMQYGALQNLKGNYVDATLHSVSSAANVPIPADGRVSLTNSDASEGYPISSFTYILLYKNQSYGDRPLDKAKTVTKLIEWMIHDGQKFAQPLNYIPLPAAALKVAKDNLKTINFGGQVL